MKQLLALALSTVCALAGAQTPAVNLMPDGSRDMYIGLGASVQPRYEGAGQRRNRALPLLQVAFSNGVFLSGMSAGWHLSHRPALELGPLLSVHPGRDIRGLGRTVGDVSAGLAVLDRGAHQLGNRLAGLDDVPARLTAGGFVNYYLAPALRLNNTVLYGAGGNGLTWEVSVQKLPASMEGPHRVALAAGLTVVNRHYNDSFFGVRAYQPHGGVKDGFIGARWNWALSPAWMVTTSARAARLTGDARTSPLVERSTQLSISTGLAYRF